MMKQYKEFQTLLKKEWKAGLLAIVIDQNTVRPLVEFIN